ncbi:hypothetical protein NKH77_12300 [Streptomyces sp. M19]
MKTSATGPSPRVRIRRSSKPHRSAAGRRRAGRRAARRAPGPVVVLQQQPQPGSVGGVVQYQGGVLLVGLRATPYENRVVWTSNSGVR